MGRTVKVAAFGAHPDDIELYMGGTLAKYGSLGHDVHTVIATDGRRGGHPVRGPWGEELVVLRKSEARTAGSHIGVEPVFLGFEDGRLVYDRSTYESVIAVLNRIQPDIVFVHGPDDYHADHRALSRMVLDASWVPVFYGDAEVGFTPDFYVDITDQMETKLAMCREYRSQDDDGWEKTIRLRGTFRGGESGLSGARYAEAFRQHRKSGWMSGYLLLPDLIPCSDGMIRFQFHNE